jgi:hypothetical protein
MPLMGSDEERRAPILFLKIHVTASFNQLLRDSSMPILGRNVDRRAPFLHLKTKVRSSLNQLLRDCSIPILGSDVELRGPISSEGQHYSQLQSAAS